MVLDIKENIRVELNEILHFFNSSNVLSQQVEGGSGQLEVTSKCEGVEGEGVEKEVRVSGNEY